MPRCDADVLSGGAAATNFAKLDRSFAFWALGRPRNGRHEGRAAAAHIGSEAWIGLGMIHPRHANYARLSPFSLRTLFFQVATSTPYF